MPTLCPIIKVVEIELGGDYDVDSRQINKNKQIHRNKGENVKVCYQKLFETLHLGKFNCQSKLG